MDLEGLRIILKAERNHRVENILATDRLSLLKLALLRRFGRDKADELRHALLHALLGIFRDFSRWWHRVLHDTRNICYLLWATAVAVALAPAAEKTAKKKFAASMGTFYEGNEEGEGVGGLTGR